jgi:hypothetical protein
LEMVANQKKKFHFRLKMMSSTTSLSTVPKLWITLYVQTNVRKVYIWKGAMWCMNSTKYEDESLSRPNLCKQSYFTTYFQLYLSSTSFLLSLHFSSCVSLPSLPLLIKLQQATAPEFRQPAIQHN